MKTAVALLIASVAARHHPHHHHQPNEHGAKLVSTLMKANSYIYSTPYMCQHNFITARPAFLDRGF